MSYPIDHPTRRVQVWVDVDEGVADFVELLNRLDGVKTFASCQGVEGGYPPYVMVAWRDASVFAELARYRPQVTSGDASDGVGYVFPEHVVNPHVGTNEVEPSDRQDGDRP